MEMTEMYSAAVKEGELEDAKLVDFMIGNL